MENSPPEEHTTHMATVPLLEVEPQAEPHVKPELTPRLLSVKKYLHTAYSPDCDFVEGIIEQRNMGELEHGRVQTRLAILLGSRQPEWGVETIVEVRLQVSPNRFRVPDLMVLHAGQKAKRIVREAPLLCIEVLSPEDTWAKMRARLNDYLTLGVEHLWCFDPETRETRRYTREGFTVVTTPDLTIPNTPIRLTLAEVFTILD